MQDIWRPGPPAGMVFDNSSHGGGAGKDEKKEEGKTILSGSLLEGVQEEEPPFFTLGDNPTRGLFGQLYRAIIELRPIIELIGKKAPGSTEPSEK